MGCGPVPAMIELPQKFTPFAMFTGMRAVGRIPVVVLIFSPQGRRTVQTAEGVVPASTLALNWIVLVPVPALLFGVNAKMKLGFTPELGISTTCQVWFIVFVPFQKDDRNCSTPELMFPLDEVADVPANRDVTPLREFTNPFVVSMPWVAVFVRIPLLKVLLAPVQTFVDARRLLAAPNRS